MHDEGPWRVVRAERGAVLVVPEPGLEPGPGTDPDPRRVPLARDGLAPATWAADDGGRVVPTVGDLVELDATGIAQILPRRTALVRDSAGRTSLTQVLAANVDVVLVVEHLDPSPTSAASSGS